MTKMPEGPEVRRVAKSLATLENRVILQANVVSGRYARGTIQGLDDLQGATIKRVTVKGKLIVFHLEKAGTPFAILSTLGMTGWWIPNFTGEEFLREYMRLELQFGDQSAAFFDPRNFGTFKVVTYPEMKRKLAELGPDILTPPNLWHAIAIPEFKARVKRFGLKLTLAEGLLDQRIAAGCGNYIRADAMYLAALSPHRLMSELSDLELERIWSAMHEIATSADQDRSAIGIPGGFENLVYARRTSPRGNTVQSYTDKHKRTVWWSPQDQ